jgi:hypothetical protein
LPSQTPTALPLEPVLPTSQFNHRTGNSAAPRVFFKQSPAGGGDGWCLSKEDIMNEWTNAKLCDVGNLILGGILFVSPWIFKFPAGAESRNAIIAGLVIAVLSIAALTAFAVWEEWLNLIVGLWLIISPWVLKFQGTTAMRGDVVIGIIVAILAAAEIWATMQVPSRQASNR